MLKISSKIIGCLSSIFTCIYPTNSYLYADGPLKNDLLWTDIERKDNNLLSIERCFFKKVLLEVRMSSGPSLNIKHAARDPCVGHPWSRPIYRSKLV
uniref:Uncharacterized protein n=1 Tax=Lepeophtheirus salmonis TaxID=72036 RepID=A0A0K2THT9_LEPSM